MSGEIWAVAEQKEGKLHRASLEVLAFCQQLGTALAKDVRVLVLGSSEAAAELEVFASVGVISIPSPGLRAYSPGSYVDALAALVRDRSPAVVVLPHTYQSVELLPRLALRFGGALVPEVTSFEVKTEGVESVEGVLWRRPILQGKVQAEVRVKSSSVGPIFVSLQSGAVRADQAIGGSAQVEVGTEPYLAWLARRARPAWMRKR